MAAYLKFNFSNVPEADLEVSGEGVYAPYIVYTNLIPHNSEVTVYSFVGAGPGFYNYEVRVRRFGTGYTYKWVNTSVGGSYSMVNFYASPDYLTSGEYETSTRPVGFEGKIGFTYYPVYTGVVTPGEDPPSDPPPDKATTPAPEDAHTDDKLSLAQLSWVDGGSATSYDIYFGLPGAATLRSSGQAGVTFDLSSITPFDYYEDYEWRIDSINEYGTTMGDTWTFTTLRFYPPLPTGVTLDDDGDPTGDPTGENAMIQVKRLVVAANNKIWFESV